MVIMFQERFAELVRTGKKCQTIRALGSRRYCAGQNLSLRKWAGLPYRSKQIVLLESIIIGTRPVHLTNEGFAPYGPNAQDLFAQSDGFSDWTDMKDWFAKVHGLPFNGILIRWKGKE